MRPLRNGARETQEHSKRQSSQSSTSTSTGKDRFPCHLCGNVYHRKEHLIRHERGHRTLRPFKCTVCDHSFSRRDVLKQHTKRHQVPHSRAEHACDRCHSRKSKCDGGDPCSSCSARALTCTRRRPFRGQQIPGIGKQPVENDDINVPGSITSSSEVPLDVDISNSTEVDVLQQLPDENVVQSARLVDVNCHEACPVTGEMSLNIDNDLDFFSNEGSGFDPVPFSDLEFTPLFDWNLSFERNLAFNEEPLFQHPEMPNRPLRDRNDITESTIQCRRRSGNRIQRSGGCLPNIEFTATQPPGLPASPPQSHWPTTLDTLACAADKQSVQNSLSGDEITSAILEGRLGCLPPIICESTWCHIEKSLFGFISTENVDGRRTSQERATTRLNSLIDLYLSTFHISWPILHRASFNMSRSPILILSVLMIGAFVDGGSDRELASYRLYSSLSSYLYNRLTNLTKVRYWSICTYQALLLNIIFGFLSPHRADAVKAEIVHGILITLVRRMGLFGDEWLKANCPHDNAEAYIHHEEGKRLALAIARLDAYTSVVHNRPPTVSFEEIAMTFPIDVRYWDTLKGDELKMFKDGKVCRQTISEIVHAFLSNQVPDTSLTAEEYQTVLCLIQYRIWQDIKKKDLRERYNGHSWIVSTNSFRGNIDIDSSISKAPTALNRLRSLLELVREHENSVDSGIPHRTSVILFSSLILWHIDVIRLEADLDAIHAVAGSMKLTSDYRERKLQKVQMWANSQAGRESVWHAAQIWRLWYQHNGTAAPELSTLCDPISYIGLFDAAVIVWAFVKMVDDEIGSENPATATCVSSNSTSTSEIPDLAFLERPNSLLVKWIEHGGMARFNGVPLCRSYLKGLLTHFESLLTRTPCTHSVGRRFLDILKGLHINESPTTSS